MMKLIKYIWKFLIWSVPAVLVVFILAAILIQTNPVKRKIASITEEQSSRFINGNLNIGKIDGNFFNRLTIGNILLISDNDTIAYINELDLNYDLLQLLHHKILIHSAGISEPYLLLKQNKDSVWNVQQILKSRPRKSDTLSEPSNIEIELPSLKLIEGTIETETTDTAIPRKFMNLNAGLSFHWETNDLLAELKELSFSTSEPDFQLQQLQFILEQDTNNIKLNDLYIRTAKNQIGGNARFRAASPETGFANLETSELQLSEFEYFLPALKIPAKPLIHINTTLGKDSIFINIEMKDRTQHIIVNAKSENPFLFLSNNSLKRLPYNIKTEFTNIELSQWIGNHGHDYLINGQLSVRGNGIDLASANMDLKGDLSDSKIKNAKLEKFLFDLNVHDGIVEGYVGGKGNFGEILLYPELRDIKNNPFYRADITAKNLDLAIITGNDSLSSDINMIATIDGKEFDPAKLISDAEIMIYESRFQQINVDTLMTNVRYQDKNIQIDTLWLLTNQARLAANGNYSFNANSDINLMLKFSGIGEFEPYIPLELKNIKTGGTVNAHLNGKTDSLEMISIIELNQNQYKDISLERMTIDAKISLISRNTTIKGRLNAEKLIISDTKIDTITAMIEGNPDSLFISSYIKNKELRTNVKAGIMPGQKLRINLLDLILDYRDQQWALQHAPALIEIDSLNYYIDSLSLAGNSGDTVQYFLAHGNISRKGQEDFMARIENIDISKINEMFDLGTGTSGYVNMMVELKGTSTDPLINGNFSIDSTSYNEYKFANFGGTVKYGKNQLKLNTLIIPRDSGRLEATVEIPLQLDLEKMEFSINENDSVNGNLVVAKIPLVIFKSFDLPGNFTGHMEGQIKVGGTLSSPLPQGNLNLADASYSIDQYGVDYEDIRLSVSFLPDKIELDTIRISSDDGSFTGSGKLDLKKIFPEWNISRTELQFDFEEFNLFDHSQFNVQITGNADLSGEKDNLVYDGELTIPRAEIYLPAILGMMNKIYIPEIPKPLLVKEAEKMSVTPRSADITTFEPVNIDTADINYFENLKGKLGIVIPRNTWIKNEDMRIEVSGQLDLIKNEKFFELFGSIDVVRGQYELLGKTFLIDKGSVSFQGGEEIVPRIDINASYTFRNPQRIKQVITVDIAGTSEYPSVKFKLDGSSITEGDALSYILFGKSMNELTMEEQDDLGDMDTGDLAGKAATSILSSQITDFLGDKLNVDYIEVKSGENFEKATLSVGKYITNDLFISYEQRFGETGEKDLATYEVEMEYELFKFLFFVLNNSSKHSGFDIIVKMSAK